MLEKVKSVKLKFGIIGNSDALNHAIQVAIQVAPTDMSVLINGESGTGKESFSKIIHSMSKENTVSLSQLIAEQFLKGLLILNFLVMKRDLSPVQTNLEKVTLK